MEFKRLEVGTFENNCYLVSCPKTGEAVIIDPAAEAEKIIGGIGKKSVKYILITHGHMDHIGALEEIREKVKAPAGIHEGDARALRRKPDFFITDGQIFKFGTLEMKALHTPGHTPGGVCFLIGKILFSGDTIFPNGPGNTALPGADYRRILESIHSKIFTLPQDTVIYPGHGLETTVGREKTTEFYPLPESLGGGGK
jgi:glyoxylase-like metal-dependent hydrolase (beta-lactamase superfamily II)